MPTIVSIELGGTGANSAATARAALGVSSSVDANAAYAQANAVWTEELIQQYQDSMNSNQGV